MASGLRHVTGAVPAAVLRGRTAAEHRKLQGSPTLPTEALASGASGRLRPQLRQTAAPAAPLRLPRARRSRTLSSPARPAARASGGAAGSAPIPDANSLKQIIQAVFRDPWDTPPRPWRTFWATKLAATVVSSDETAGQVEVVPVETSGLRFPNDQSDALHRLRTNAVLYRQNYALIALGALALGTLRARTGPWHLAVLAAFVAYALCSSDRLLSEAQLASNGRLVWNAKRAAGLDRALVIRVAPVVAFLAVAACPLATIQWVLSSGVLAALLVLSHAVLRPVDLESTFAQIWGDITSAKSRDDVASAIKSAGDGLSRWWTSFKSEPAEPPPPVIIVKKGSDAGGAAGGPRPPQSPSGGGGAPPPPPSKQLPPGSKR